MAINLSYRPLALIGVLTLTTLLAACAATNASDPASPRTQRYTTQECKQMYGRGVINLDQKRKCDMGMSFDTQDKAQSQ